MRKAIEQENYQGNERKVGFEIEYTGLPLKQVADIICQLFGGNTKKVTDVIFKVNDTELGDFTLELDAIPLQKLAKNKQKVEEESEKNAINDLSIHIGKAIENVGSKIAPFEIVSPPIALSSIEKMEDLRKALLKAGAEDTKENIYAAFGLHINPEVASLKVDYIVCHLQSFLLLAPWLEKLHEIDLTRRITSFSDPFPKSYLELTLDKNYAPSIEQLLRDYHEHNPTRNRALDMLPLFAYIDEPLIRNLYGQKEKINKRPTFHYRLPNCELANENWSLNTEWKRWLHIEELANDKELLYNLINQWQEYQERWFSSKSEWIKAIEGAMRNNNAA